MNSSADDSRKIFLIAVGVMALVAVLATLLTSYFLYQAALVEQKTRLHETLHGRALMLSAAHQAFTTQRHKLEEVEDASASRVVIDLLRALSHEDDRSNNQLHNHNIEFFIGKMEGGKAVLLDEKHDHYSVEHPEAIIVAGVQRALQDQSGVEVVVDQGGEEVLVAHQAVEGAAVGLVAKVNLSEIRAIFTSAMVIALLGSLFLVLFGATMLRRRLVPLVQKIKTSERMAQQANLEKDEFFASITHELRTPLTSIIGNSELLLEELSDPIHIRSVRAIEVSGRCQLALVNDILDMSKIKSGKFVINEPPYDLELVVQKVDVMFAVRAKELGLKWKIKNDYQGARHLLGDEQRISQILINLVGNAMKFTDEGGVTLSVYRAGDQLYFDVKDTGIGMSADAMTKLFQRFEQADESISRDYGGSGLGLHISLNLADMMGGSIDVSSREGEGSTFQLVLPYRPVEDALIKVSANQQKEIEMGVGQFEGEVLVAEDTELLKQLEKRMLEKCGVSVTLAGDGQEAVDRALEQQFDLILMDMQMPVLDGLEATRRIRAAGGDMPIIAVTANVMEKHKDAFREAGCDGFLDKPFEKEGLITVLGQYLQPKRVESETDTTEKEVSETHTSMLRGLPQEVRESLLKEFFERVGGMLVEMKHALAVKDWKQLHQLSHVLKGGGAPYGFAELSRKASEVCDAVDQGADEQLPELVTALIREVEAVSSSH